MRADRGRYHARRGLAAFEALRGKISAGGISADLAYLVPTSPDVIDWLSTRVRTSDVVRLCAEKGWRVGFAHSTARARRRDFTPFDEDRVTTCMRSNGRGSCDEAIACAEKSLNLSIGRACGRQLWVKAGLSRPRGRPKGAKRSARINAS
jgi:hypothetical protein